MAAFTFEYLTNRLGLGCLILIRDWRRFKGSCSIGTIKILYIFVKYLRYMNLSFNINNTNVELENSSKSKCMGSQTVKIKASKVLW
jgi:1-aminocyclopropane-1-carboxylate deaminase/D-cysteine desulfhydrase-like pyridoxal-dependent ACC family enzyme